jgi:positive regulator of sigma E activity
VTRSAAAIRPAVVAVLNLVLPGGGLVLLDATWTGLLFGAAFIFLLNLALLAVFVTPDDFAAAGRAAAIAAVVLGYAAAQIGMATHLRRFREDQALAERRRILREIERLAAVGDAAAALRLLESLAGADSADLALAHCRATLLAALGRRDEARAAWEHLRRVDRHGVYRDITRTRA